MAYRSRQEALRQEAIGLDDAEHLTPFPVHSVRYKCTLRKDCDPLAQYHGKFIEQLGEGCGACQ